MIDAYVEYQNGDEICAWNQEPCFDIFTSQHISQKLIFYRKERQNFLLTKIHVNKTIDISQLNNELKEISKIKHKNILKPTYTKITCSEEGTIFIYYHKFELGTLQYYISCVLAESNSDLSDCEAKSLFLDLKYLNHNLEKNYKGVELESWRTVLTKSMHFQIIEMNEYDLLCDTKPIHHNEGVTNTIFGAIENKSIIIEDEISSNFKAFCSEIANSENLPFKTDNDLVFSEFLFYNAEKIDHFHYKIYEKIIDLTPLEKTMQDHYFLQDMLTIQDPEKRLDFWIKYTSYETEPLKLAERYYKRGRWTSLVVNDVESRSLYDKAQLILNQNNLNETFLQAALYDAFACHDFFLHEYQGSRDNLYRSLKLIEKIFGPDSFQSIIGYSNLTHVYKTLNDMDKARAYTQKAIDITLQTGRKDDDIIFSVFYGNKIVLTEDEAQRQHNLKKVIEVKRKYWANYHPNVLLTFNNFFYLAERSYNIDFEFNNFVDFEIKKYHSHLNYFGCFHHTIFSILVNVCRTLAADSNQGCRLLKFLSQIKKECEIVHMIPIIEDSITKLLRINFYPQARDSYKRTQSSAKYYRIRKNPVVPEYYEEHHIRNLRSEIDYLKNELFVDEIDWT